MRKQLVYDLPTRIFHWLFAGLFATAFFIGKTVDDDSPTFSYHMLAGIILASLVILRLIWGFIGSKYARFQSFALKPNDLIQYIKGIFSGDKKRWAGHNPASSWAAIVMFLSSIMLAVTGFLMTTGKKEEFEEVHEIFAHLFLVTVLFHIAGIVIHTIRHSEIIGLSMVDGKKLNNDQEPEQAEQKPVAAIVFVILVFLISMSVLKNYNPENKQLNLFGSTLTLGEDEEEEHGEDHEEEEHEDEEHDSDEEEE